MKIIDKLVNRLFYRNLRRQGKKEPQLVYYHYICLRDYIKYFDITDKQKDTVETVYKRNLISRKQLP